MRASFSVLVITLAVAASRLAVAEPGHAATAGLRALVTAAVSAAPKQPPAPPVDLKHVPTELLKFGLTGLLAAKDRKALEGCEPELRIRKSSFEKLGTKEILSLVRAPQLDTFKDKKLVDFGGGHSTQLPYLRQAGVGAYSLDPTYGEVRPPTVFYGENKEKREQEEKERRAFVEKYEKDNATALIRGKLEDLDRLVTEASVDVVTSHLTWFYIGGSPFLTAFTKDPAEKKKLEEKARDAQTKALVDTLRVLKSGGTARINGVTDEVRAQFLATLPPDKGGYDFAEMESQLPAACNAVFDRGYNVDGQRPERWLFLRKR